jgi:hypothetical protein
MTLDIWAGLTLTVTDRDHRAETELNRDNAVVNGPCDRGIKKNSRRSFRIAISRNPIDTSADFHLSAPFRRAIRSIKRADLRWVIGVVA